jgi:hypothetical protein
MNIGAMESPWCDVAALRDHLAMGVECSRGSKNVLRQHIADKSDLGNNPLIVNCEQSPA